ncbi:MAG: hypothetical protein WCL29_02650 [Pseudomonadota bacterium]
MPYFVYRITHMPLLRLEKIGEFAKFAEAANHAKALRVEADPAQEIIKVIHAATKLHAEDLLSQVRIATPESRADE